jgi:hypothetical protein
MKNLEFYLHSFRNLKVGEAWAFLSSLDALDDIVLIWNPHEQKFNRTNPRDIFDAYGQLDACDDIGPVQFSGGPPGHTLWATGSMTTFTLDKVMYHVAHEELIKRAFGPKVAVRC